jgi:UPF0716 protein FxsA
MLIVLAALIIVVPIVEISLIVYVGDHLGVLPTVGLLVASAVIGSWLLRREGRRAWRAFREATAAGRTPAQEAVEGVVVLVGGLLMMLPGFSTDVIGLLLIVPPIRRLVARLVLVRLVRGLPPSLATDLLGPKRVRARRGKGQRTEPAPQVQSLPPQEGHQVIEGEIEPRA